ncbi:MAG: anti-sigma factor domain-containing protein [Bacteroidota bacterium]
MTPEEFKELSADYAVGALEGESLKRFENHLMVASREEFQHLAELLGVAAMLPLVLKKQEPPVRVKQQVMQKIQLSSWAKDSVERRTKELTDNVGTDMNESDMITPRPVTTSPPVAVPERRSWLTFGITFVALAMIIGFSVFMVRLMGTIDEQNKQLVSVGNEKQELQTQLVALKDELQRKQEILNVLAAKQVEIAVMNGLDVHPVGYGKIIWDPERKRAILQVSNLPAIPSDKDYQLWVVKGKQPISAGVFVVHDAESNYFKIENLAVTDPKEIAAFAVTLEPKGGVPQPTGAMYMAGAPRL